MNEKNTLIDFAEKIGKLTKGLKELEKHFSNHLSDHKVDRIMQWAIIGLQLIVMIFVGKLMLS